MSWPRKMFVLVRSLPYRAMWGVVLAMWSGIEKHAGDRWYQTMFTNDYWEDKCQRHLGSYIRGELKDHDSGLHPLAHKSCNALLHHEAALRGLIHVECRQQKEK